MRTRSKRVRTRRNPRKRSKRVRSRRRSRKVRSRKSKKVKILRGGAGFLPAAAAITAGSVASAMAFRRYKYPPIKCTTDRCESYFYPGYDINRGWWDGNKQNSKRLSDRWVVKSDKCPKCKSLDDMQDQLKDGDMVMTEMGKLIFKKMPNGTIYGQYPGKNQNVHLEYQDITGVISNRFKDIETRSRKDAEKEVEDTCPICLEKIVKFPDETCRNCGRKIHQSCLSKWRERGNNTCPYCRKEI